MSKDPAFLFYPSDFLTGTMFMSNDQLGIYIRLLCSQHQHGGIISKPAFNSLVKDDELIRTKFIETETGYYNERLTIEMEKRNKKSNNMSETAKLVWERRKEQQNTIALQKQSKRNTKVKKNDTNVIQTVNVNEDINKTELEIAMFHYLEMRKKKNAVPTPHALDLINKDLEKFSKGDEKIKIEILNLSTKNNWTGIFEPKPTNGTPIASKPVYTPPPPNPKPARTKEQVEAEIRAELEADKNKS